MQDQLHSKSFSSRLDHTQQTADPFSTWKFSPLFKDKGLPLPQTILESYVSCVKAGLLNKSGLGDKSDLRDKSGLGDKSGFMDTKGINACPTNDLNLVQAGAELVAQLKGHAHTHLAMMVQLMLAQKLLNIALQQQTPVHEDIKSEDSSTGPESSSFYVISPQVSELCKASPGIELVSLITKVIGERKTDFDLALGYLVSSGKQGLKALSEANSELGLDYDKTISLACLGIKFCGLTGFLKPMESFKMLLVNATWGKKLEGLGISFKHAFTGIIEKWKKKCDRKVWQAGVSRKYISIEYHYLYCQKSFLSSKD